MIRPRLESQSQLSGLGGDASSISAIGSTRYKRTS